VAAPQLPVELSRSIERCAEALGDLTRLKTEVTALKSSGDGLAHFASALFELEMAREGDSESRSHLSHLAEVLMVFWQDGSGDEISRMHPALQSLWLSVAPMLVQFEMRRFETSLSNCWKLRDDTRALTRAIEELEPAGNRRVEFARCVYHLELVRKGVESSRAEFAKRAGLLAEAYQDPSFANDLVGHDAGLIHLWAELRPYLDEFFEHLEEQAARKQEGTRKVKIPSVPSIPPSSSSQNLPVVAPAIAPAVTPPPRPEGKTDPEFARVALGDTPEVPSFRSLVNKSKAAAAPPNSDSNATPPGGWVPDADVIIDAEEESAPPPPPLNLTPPGSWFPPKDLNGDGGDVDIVEADFEAPPPPPAITPAHGLAAAIAQAPGIPYAEDIDVEFEPDEATLAFWDYTFAALQQAPVDGQKPRMLATESRTDRKRLTTWLDGMGNHLAVPEARAFASLVRLVLAGETKEKSLFGQANPRRKEALDAAFSLLSPTPEAAGKAAVWFELDGSETREALFRGLELLFPFLAFCARHELDPLAPAARAKYLEDV
jgi:hypothetical protein